MITLIAYFISSYSDSVMLKHSERKRSHVSWNEFMKKKVQLYLQYVCIEIVSVAIETP